MATSACYDVSTRTGGAGARLFFGMHLHKVQRLSGGCNDQHIDAGDCGVKSDPATGKEGDIYKIQEGLADLALPADLLRHNFNASPGREGAGSSRQAEKHHALLSNATLDVALVRAASQGDVQGVEALLLKGARVNCLYVPPPAKGGDIQIRPSGCSPLHAAAEKGSCAVARMLLQRGARVNGRDRDGGTALHRAAYWGQHEVISLLIEHGADAQARDRDGMSPLHNAAIQGRSQVAGGLVAVGANVNAGDEAADTALHLACLYGHTDTVKKLLECKAAVDARNVDNITALHNAVAFGHTDTVALLLKAGSNCNMPDAEGNTALHTAVMVGRVDMVAYLLAHEADCSRTNQAGLTPYTSARKHNVNPQVTKVLRKYLSSCPDRCNATKLLATDGAVSGASLLHEAPVPERRNLTGVDDTGGGNALQTGPLVDEALQARLRGGCDGCGGYRFAGEGVGRRSIGEPEQGSNRIVGVRLCLRGGGMMVKSRARSGGAPPSRVSTESRQTTLRGGGDATPLLGGKMALEVAGAAKLDEGSSSQGGAGGTRAVGGGCKKHRRRRGRHCLGWQEQYEQLMLYRMAHGHTQVSQTEGGLGMWAAIQRHHAASGMLRLNRVAKLKAIGFSFDPLGAVWMRNFRNLLLHKQMHGDCNPLQTAGGAEGALGRWVGQQRHLFQHGSLRPDRQHHLDSAGFIYRKADLDWERHFRAFEQQQSVERVREVDSAAALEWAGGSSLGGHARGPSTSMQDPSADAITPSRLSAWVSYQRDLLRRGRLRAERQHRLEQAGMVWSVRDAQWSSNFDRLRRCLAVSRALSGSQSHGGVSIASAEPAACHFPADEDRVHWSGEGVGEEPVGSAYTSDFLRGGQIFLEGGHKTAAAPDERGRRRGVKEEWELGIRERGLLLWVRNQRSNVRRNQLRADRLRMMQQLPLALGAAAGRAEGVRGAGCASDQEADARLVRAQDVPRMKLLPSRVFWQAAAQQSL